MEQIQKKEVAKNYPEKKFRAGPIVATVWSNENKTKDGEIVSYKTVSCQRTYKDKNNQWQTTASLRMNDLPKAILVLTKAYEALSLADDSVEEEA